MVVNLNRHSCEATRDFVHIEIITKFPDLPLPIYIPETKRGDPSGIVGYSATAMVIADLLPERFHRVALWNFKGIDTALDNWSEKISKGCWLITIFAELVKTVKNQLIILLLTVKRNCWYTARKIRTVLEISLKST